MTICYRDMEKNRLNYYCFVLVCPTRGSMIQRKIGKKGLQSGTVNQVIRRKRGIGRARVRQTNLLLMVYGQFGFSLHANLWAPRMC